MAWFISPLNLTTDITANQTLFRWTLLVTDDIMKITRVNIHVTRKIAVESKSIWVNRDILPAPWFFLRLKPAVLLVFLAFSDIDVGIPFVESTPLVLAPSSFDPSLFMSSQFGWFNWLFLPAASGFGSNRLLQSPWETYTGRPPLLSCFAPTSL